MPLPVGLCASGSFALACPCLTGALFYLVPYLKKSKDALRGDLSGLDRPVFLRAMNPALVAQRQPAFLWRPVKGAAPARPKGGDMVDLRGWLLSLVIGLGFWSFVAVCLSLLIK